ncbi:hypothetical protein [Paenibacillus sp. NPDC058071]|uniref:hypothetical protein n=1 Tax=Paenibacillus sp. NPDC058071 TaxID=3346326 RepID=UPI0036D77E42
MKRKKVFVSLCAITLFVVLWGLANTFDSQPTLKDETTVYKLPVVAKLKEDQQIYQMNSDGMLRDSQYSVHVKLVVEAVAAPFSEAVKRGDVVVYATGSETLPLMWRVSSGCLEKPCIS